MIWLPVGGYIYIYKDMFLNRLGFKAWLQRAPYSLFDVVLLRLLKQVLKGLLLGFRAQGLNPKRGSGSTKASKTSSQRGSFGVSGSGIKP